MAIFLSFANSAIAGYRPPPSQKPPSGYTESSGVRGGCRVTGVGEVVLLAPRQHVGQTTAIYPSFAWFVPQKQAMKLQFSLYEFDDNEEPTQLIYQRQLASLQGMHTISLPKGSSGLKVGKKYLWQVESLCNENRPSENFLVRAEMEVVEMLSSLKVALAKTRDRVQRMKLFGAYGMWYDAVAEVNQHRELLA